MEESVSTKPVCELYYDKAGDLTMGVEQARAGGDSKFTKVGNVPVGTTFSYTIAYENNVLYVAIYGESAQTLSTYSLDAPASYFKAATTTRGISRAACAFSPLTFSTERRIESRLVLIHCPYRPKKW